MPFDRRVWHECTTLTQAGYEVSVICPRGKRHDRDPYERRDGVRIIRYPTPPEAHGLAGYPKEYGAMLAWTLRAAGWLWRRRPFDVIHACNPPDLFFLVGRVFRPLGVSFVFDQHDANPEIMVAKRGGEVRDAFPERVVRWAERSTFALADLVISPNESYRRIALTRGGVRPDDAVVVRSAPRLAEFAPGRGGHFDRRGHRFLVAYLGVMGAQDGVDLLVRAAAARVRAGQDILLYLAGDGESYDDIVRLTRDEGLADRTLMPGFQTREEFEPALGEADVCVAPDPSSPFNDISTMNKIIEYMAMGVPCLTFGLPENRVSGGDAVAYADDLSWEGLASALGRLLDDEPERRRLAAAGRERFEQALAWEHQAPNLLRAYARLAEKLGWAPRPGGRGAPDAADDGVATPTAGDGEADRTARGRVAPGTDAGAGA